MLLTALRRPFLYFPLENHFEQNLVVAERVARHKAGKRMRYAETTPELLADAVVGLIDAEANWPAIRTDGAQRAAQLISELVPGPRHKGEQCPTIARLDGGRADVRGLFCQILWAFGFAGLGISGDAPAGMTASEAVRL